MIKLFKGKHLIYYLSLITILFLGICLIIQSSYNRNTQLLVVLMTTLFYILWGIIHHLINHDLTSKIMVEYLLMGGFGAAIVLFFIKGV